MKRLINYSFLMILVLGMLGNITVISAELEDAIPRNKPSDHFTKLTESLENSVKETYTPLTTSEAWDNTFFIHPTRLSGNVDFKEVKQYYSYKTREVPVFKYETYKVVVRTTSGEVKEVTKRRKVEQTGTKKQKYLVKDPNGKICKIRKIPIKDPKAGGLQVRNGVIAQNSMGLLAAIKSGLPQEDPKIQEYLESLNEVIKYGLPDYTWDLAWLTAAYVNLPNKKDYHKTLCQEMVNKLILGVNTQKGKAQGLWGPVCVNPVVLANMMNYQQKMMGKVKGKRGKKKSKEGEVDEKLEEAGMFQDQFKMFTVLFKYNYMGKRRYYTTIGKNEADPGLRVANFPFFVFGEFLYDMESTGIAVYAIHEAWKNGLLPQRTSMPKNDRKREIMKSEKVSSILDTALKALVKKQQKDGGWSENYLWMPVHNFDKTGIMFLPVKDDDFVELKTKTTPLSNSQGYLAVKYLADMLGKTKIVSKELKKAEALIHKEFETLKGDNFSLPLVNDHPEVVFEYFLYLTPHEKLRSQVLDALAEEIGKVPGAGGNTERDGEVLVSDLLEQHIDLTVKRDNDWINKLKAKPKKGDMKDKLKRKDISMRRSWYGQLRYPNFMSHALGLIISSELTTGDSPIAAYWPASKNSYDTKFKGALAKKIAVASGTKPNFQRIPGLDLYKKDYSKIPILIASDSIPAKYFDKTAEKFAKYIEAGGTILLMGQAGKNDETVAKLQAKLEKAIFGMEKKIMTAEGGLKVPCLVADGVPKVLMIKVGKKDSAKGMKASSAMKLAMSVMQKKLGPEYKPAGSPEIDAITICQQIYEQSEKEKREKTDQAFKEAAEKKAAEDAAKKAKKEEEKK